MPDSAAIDAAIVSKLLADATLMALATDGVYIDEAAQNAKKFVIVSLVDESDAQQFGGRAFEDALYLVKFVELSTTSANAKTAAARIDTLLEQGTLTATGYGLMMMRREARLVPQVEVDEADPSIRWQHRGGHYRIVMST
jgi:hypothetical protein